MITDEYGMVRKCNVCHGRTQKRGGRIRVEHRAACPIGKRVESIRAVRGM